jgi:hypothetical protein
VNLFDNWNAAISYAEFLEKYGTASDRGRWQQVFDRVALSADQVKLLGSFTREMKVMCLAGAWCGDCANQCPIFARFALSAPVIQLRFLDRDDHADVQTVLKINGGNRVPVAVFFSEDGFEVARFGERTVSAYRNLIGIPAGTEPLLTRVCQDWLNEFERVQWILRLSPRLRQKHGD